MTLNTVGAILPAPDQGPAFDAIAEGYDQIFTHSALGQAHRRLVHAALRRHLRKGQRAVDLNCGTGEDAIYLGSLGISVVACDISERMIDIAQQKAIQNGDGLDIIFSVCPNEELDKLSDQEAFDAVLSNFGGLNCSTDLSHVARTLAPLVHPGGKAFLCMMGRVCAWEILWYAVHGNWEKAFRRFNRGGTRASIGGASVHVQYPSVRDMRLAFAPSFRLESWRGIGLALPPSWLDAAFRDHPWLVELLTRIDRLLGALPGFRGLADHILFQFVREEK